MTTDRELLEKAAKAAGMNVFPEAGAEPWPKVDGWFFCVQHGDPGMHFCPADNRAHRTGPWKPLHEDGDALRLAVKLRISLIFEQEYMGGPVLETLEATSPPRSGDGSRDVSTESLSEGDEMANTRRAIVRAAAAIGEQMQ